MPLRGYIWLTWRRGLTLFRKIIWVTDGGQGCHQALQARFSWKLLLSGAPSIRIATFSVTWTPLPVQMEWFTKISRYKALSTPGTMYHHNGGGTDAAKGGFMVIYVLAQGGL